MAHSWEALGTPHSHSYFAHFAWLLHISSISVALQKPTSGLEHLTALVCHSVTHHFWHTGACNTAVTAPCSKGSHKQTRSQMSSLAAKTVMPEALG